MSQKQNRSPRHTIEPFAAALAGAESERQSGSSGERSYPDPLCLNRPHDYVDYDCPPDADQAADLCIDCPLMVLCLANARRTRPAWGVWGGVAWVAGRQLHLLDDERREKYLAQVA